LKDLASDRVLPKLSRVTIYLEQYFFLSNNITTFTRYDWDLVLEGLRALLKSGKLQRFELRMSDPGRATVRTKEIQEGISKMVGRTAEVEGRGCNKCLPYEKGVSRFQDTDFSLVWKAEKGESLSVKDCEEGVEILDVKHCQRCGKLACERYEGWEEDEEFVYP
jgi:hypothetical protein